jgi:hypothetical protein
MAPGQGSVGRSVAARAVVVVWATVLTGCAVSPFHNAARDQQGQALVQAAGKVELAALVDDVDRRFAALRALELETLRARAATQRELEIAAVVSPGPDGKGTLNSRYVQPLLDARLQRLVGRTLDAAALDEVLLGSAEREARDGQVQSALRTFNGTAGLNLASCAAARTIAAADGKLRPEARARIEANRRASADVLLANLLRRCDTAAAIQPAVAEPGSELLKLSDEFDEAQQRAARYRAALVQHRSELQAAGTRFQAELDAATPKSGDASASGRLKSAAAVLGSALGVLREGAKLSADAFGHAEALERVEALDAVVSAVAGGAADLGTLSGDEKRAVATARLIASVADEIDTAVAATRKPRLAPLLLALEQQRLIVKGFEAHAGLLERRAALRRQQLDAGYAELTALAQARRVLGPPAAAGAGATVELERPFAEAAVDSGDALRRRVALYESLARYFDQVLHHRQRGAELAMAFNATADEQAMLASRTAAAQWSSLLQQMAAVLAEHHAAGIKAADLAEFLKGFGLVTIGARVGQ